MKEIKAFIHRNRVADIIHTLKIEGFCSKYCSLSVIDVKGTLEALHDKERDYSLELGETIITEIKLELVCADDCVDDIIRVIREKGRTGQKHAGWVYVSEISAAYAIDD